MRTIWGKKGRAVTLPCGLEQPADESFALEWRKNNKLIVSAYGTETGHTTPLLMGRIGRASGLGLTIHAIQAEDAGVFHCVLTTFSKQPTLPQHGPSIRLVVNYGPKIVYPPSETTEYVKSGESFNMECNVDGAPPPEVTWTKDSRIISSSPVLHIANITSSDKGRYTCLAVSVDGTDSRTVELKFSKQTTFDFVPSNKTVVVGANVFWHCHATSQPDRISYSWRFQDRPIRKTPTGLRADIQDGDLSLREVRKADRGWYLCEATNSKGDVSQASAYLDVQYAPEAQPTHRQMITIGMGRNGSIECDVDANPPATRFSWSKNGHFLRSSDKSVLEITSAKDLHGGIYQCQASNSVGEGDRVETHLIVAEPPSFISRPPSEIRVRIGTTIDIPCEGFGDPLPIVYWIRNQTRISSSVLSFSPVTHTDHGTYECLVSNAVSTLSTQMSLIVERSKPQPATISRVNCEGTNELRVYWEPGFDGSYSQTFTVHYQSDLEPAPTLMTTNNNTVLLDNLRPFAVYTIHIESRNKEGSSDSIPVSKPVCSVLPSPSAVYFDGSSVRWSKVEEAKSYLLESRSSSRDKFEKLGETLHPYYKVSRTSADEFLEARVRSLRPFYTPSKPSSVISLGAKGYTEIPVSWSICGGLLFFLFALLLWIACRRKHTHLRRKKSICTYKCSSAPSQPPTETYYEPSLNILDDGEYGEWTGPGNNSMRIPYPKELMELEYGTEDGLESSVVDDMLRKKYIYDVEDVPTQLITDLRIERLRREYKQSHL